jgi:hypothetical protein
MKKIYLTLAAASAFAVAAPAAAQSWHGDRSAPQSWNGDRSNTAQLAAQLDAGIQSGSISRRSARGLREQLRQISQLERQYSMGGFNGWERGDLRERSRTLSMNIRSAQNNGYGRPGRDDRYSDKDRGYDGQAGFQHDRGDRFAGDLRVGQHFSARQVALPMEYRARYQDSDRSFYRYDDRRVYQIDRTSGLIMAMFDLVAD